MLRPSRLDLHLALSQLYLCAQMEQGFEAQPAVVILVLHSS